MTVTRAAIAVALAALLAGCSWLPIGIPSVHRITIQQGNVITQDMIDQLKPGMSKRQVAYVMGEPVLENTFRLDRWDYVYTIQVGAAKRRQQQLTLYFEDDELVSFVGDFVPSDVAQEGARAARTASGAAGDPSG